MPLFNWLRDGRNLEFLGDRDCAIGMLEPFVQAIVDIDPVLYDAVPDTACAPVKVPDYFKYYTTSRVEFQDPIYRICHTAGSQMVVIKESLGRVFHHETGDCFTLASTALDLRSLRSARQRPQ
jgi:hypothetical protein